MNKEPVQQMSTNGLFTMYREKDKNRLKSARKLSTLYMHVKIDFTTTGSLAAKEKDLYATRTGYCNLSTGSH